MNLRTRFTLTMTLCVIVLYSGTSWLVYSLARRAGLEHLDERIGKNLTEFMGDIDWKEDGIDLDFHFKSAPEFGERSRAAFYELRDHHGVVVRSYSLGLEESLPVFDNDATATTPRLTRLSDGVQIRALGAAFRPVIDEDAKLRPPLAPPPDSPENLFHLTVAESTAGVDQHLHDVAGALLLGGSVLVVACAVVSALAARWLNQPIVRLAENVADIDAASLHKRLTVAGTPGEMRPIIAQFNALLDRLTDAMQRERRFSSAIAHELRTPLAELQALADVALIDSGPDATLREDPREVFTETAAIAARMGRLLDLLAVIHRREDGQTQLQEREIDLRPLVSKTAEAMRQAITGSGRTLGVTLPEQPVMVSADPNVTEAIVANLVRNALQHADAASRIEIEVTASPAVVKVGNRAASLTAEDLPRLTDPLWQKDEARTHRDRFGIGLTLCRAYAELLGARLRFDLTNGMFSASVEIGGDAKG